MNLHPFDEVVANAQRLILLGAQTFQQFNCQVCGTKQTMDEPDKFFTQGLCEECGGLTDIRKNGCNLLVMKHLTTDYADFLPD